MCEIPYNREHSLLCKKQNWSEILKNLTPTHLNRYPHIHVNIGQLHMIYEKRSTIPLIAFAFSLFLFTITVIDSAVSSVCLALSNISWLLMF